MTVAGPGPSRELEHLLAGLRAAGSFSGDLAAMRDLMARAPAYPRPDDVRWEPVDADGVPAEWVIPDGTEPDRVVVHLHGGGYATGTIEGSHGLSSHLARATRARLLAVDYRLAPEHPFPAALDDALAAVRFASAELGPARTALVGDSSGGGLALGVLVALRDAGAPLPATAVCLCPWTDLTLSGASIASNAASDPMVSAATLGWMVDAYLGERDRRSPLASPLFADLTGLPPLLVQASTAELLADDARRLAERATACGVDVTLQWWDHVVHVWHAFADLLPEARDAIARVGAHVDEVLGHGATGPDGTRS